MYHEGFGIPIAWIYGMRDTQISSDAASMPEVLGNSAILFWKTIVLIRWIKS